MPRSTALQGQIQYQVLWPLFKILSHPKTPLSSGVFLGGCDPFPGTSASKEEVPPPGRIFQFLNGLRTEIMGRNIFQAAP